MSAILLICAVVLQVCTMLTMGVVTWSAMSREDSRFWVSALLASVLGTAALALSNAAGAP